MNTVLTNNFHVFLSLQNKVSKYLPLILCGIVAIIAGILSLILPETRNTTLPESIEDCNKQGHSSVFSLRRSRFESVNSQASDSKANTTATELI